MSTQWNQQRKSNIRTKSLKKYQLQKISSTKQMNKVQNIRIEICK